MKKYIGTKEVLAQPMTSQEAVEKGYNVNNHESDDITGQNQEEINKTNAHFTDEGIEMSKYIKFKNIQGTSSMSYWIPKIPHEF